MLEKIVKKRIQSGISQQKLADKIGVCKGTISNFENGHNFLNSDALFKMFDVLGIELLIKD